MGLRINNAVIYDGEAWNQKFNIADAAAAKLKMVTVFKGSDADGTEQLRVDAVYDGGSGGTNITTSDYNNFPVGSTILDVDAFAYYLKTDATTWKTEALS